jgi:hypothetical protein
MKDRKISRFPKVFFPKKKDPLSIILNKNDKGYDVERNFTEVPWSYQVGGQ